MVCGSLETSKFLSIEFRRLAKIAKILSGEIRKYDLNRAKQSSEEDQIRGSKKRSLRGLVEKCEELAGELYQLRPSVKFIESKLE